VAACNIDGALTTMLRMGPFDIAVGQLRVNQSYCVGCSARSRGKGRRHTVPKDNIVEGKAGVMIVRVGLRIPNLERLPGVGSLTNLFGLSTLARAAFGD
jgi:hypothetical protein